MIHKATMRVEKKKSGFCVVLYSNHRYARAGTVVLLAVEMLHLVRWEETSQVPGLEKAS